MEKKDIQWNLKWGKVPGWQGERHASWTLIAINKAVKQCIQNHLNDELSKLQTDFDGECKWRLTGLEETATGFGLTFKC